MTITPLARFIVVRVEPDTPRSTILTVPSTDSPHQWATITAVGPDVRDTKVGQRVYCSSNQGHWVGDKMLLPETSILLIDRKDGA